MITIEAATLEIFDPLKSTPKSLTVRDAYFKVGHFSGPQTASAGSSLLAINGYCTAESFAASSWPARSIRPPAGSP